MTRRQPLPARKHRCWSDLENCMYLGMHLRIRGPVYCPKYSPCSIQEGAQTHMTTIGPELPTLLSQAGPPTMTWPARRRSYMVGKLDCAPSSHTAPWSTTQSPGSQVHESMPNGSALRSSPSSAPSKALLAREAAVTDRPSAGSRSGGLRVGVHSRVKRWQSVPRARPRGEERVPRGGNRLLPPLSRPRGRRRAQRPRSRGRCPCHRGFYSRSLAPP